MIGVVALLHESGAPVQTHQIIIALKDVAGRTTAALRKTASQLGAVAREGWARFRSGTMPTVADPLEPLSENAPPLPGTSDRAFWTGLIVVSLSVVSGLATYLILTGLTPIVPRNEVVLAALFINVLLVVAMVMVIAAQMIGLRRAWKKKVAGARLHARIVALFSLIAALPALLLAVAATTTFSRALDSWFNQQTMAIVRNSLVVGNAYLLEHGQVIRTDIVNMARDLDEEAAQVAGDQRQFRELMIGQAALRDLPVAYVIDGTGMVKVAVLEDDRIPYVTPPAHLIRSAAAGQVPLLMPLKVEGLDSEKIPYDLLPDHLVRDAQRGRVAAITKLHNYPDSYLYVARGVDPKVVRHLRQTHEGVAAYEELRRARGGLELAHGLLYFMISLTALLAAIWVGLWFAGLFVTPIRRLISAAQEVARGNLTVELPIKRGEGDLRRLSMNFNAMTKELERQRTDLVTANSQLTERRQFMEAVLSGVSAGVIGLDRDGRITIASRSAEQLLGRNSSDLLGRELAEAVPEFAVLLQERSEGAKSRPQNQVTLVIDGEERNFAVRVTRQAPGEEAYGSVVTFDDVTELVSAQRTSAWADVARRIAHEIKNPLTPIQLSAERIRRKYGKVITEDRETFDRCTETIIRQVGDVTRMVDEFSAFARSPKPQMEEQDIRDVVKAAVLDRQMSGSDIAFETKVGKEPIIVSCDRRLISQAVINLVKNAQEAIQTYTDNPEREPGWKGRIETSVRRRADRVDIEIIDNAAGLPKHNRNRLLEPYVTTKGSKGTGLGLAIVQKSVEQHNGTLTLDDAPPAPGRTHGALIRITLPVVGARSERPAQQQQPEPAAVGGNA
jgi:two-component system, NtrC family, nitrogen regulation sensor histidine kinase NtrY